MITINLAPKSYKESPRLFMPGWGTNKACRIWCMCSTWTSCSLAFHHYTVLALNFLSPQNISTLAKSHKVMEMRCIHPCKSNKPSPAKSARQNDRPEISRLHLICMLPSFRCGVLLHKGAGQVIREVTKGGNEQAEGAAGLQGK